METKIKLPVGVDSFEKIRNGNYYYVDKTMLIEQVLDEGSEVTLFTRPRRFGKTVNDSVIEWPSHSRRMFPETGNCLENFARHWYCDRVEVQ